jgi:zinc D-Ala-D-Ala dipeptidase
LFSKPLAACNLTVLLFLLNACSYEHGTKENRTYTLTKKIVYMVQDPAPVKVEIPVPRDTSYLEHVFGSYDLVDIETLDSTIQVDLRYGDTNNFLGRGFYDGLRRAYFTCDLAIRICNAQLFLKEIDPALSIVVLDAARPLHIQAMMWDSLDMQPDKKYSYLAPPYETSMHNYACAADVTIADGTGRPLEMGTTYDHFHKLSQPLYEERFLKSGELSQEAYFNRRLLRYVMKRAGLKPIQSEWWHFGLCTKPEAMARYALIR